MVPDRYITMGLIKWNELSGNSTAFLATVRDIHKYFLWFNSFSFILVPMNIPTQQLDICLEMVLQGVTILLHNLVRKVLTNEAPNYQTLQTSPRSFNSPSALGCALLKLLQAATITPSPRPKCSGSQKWIHVSHTITMEW
jgi:hypothetical protein